MRKFDIKIHDYNRGKEIILISSGFGLGLALMDQFTDCRYFFDIDNYRDQQIDWECLGIRLSFSKLKCAIMCGWFTVDEPKNFNLLKQGLIMPVFTYIGGTQSLKDFIAKTEILLQSF